MLGVTPHFIRKVSRLQQNEGENSKAWCVVHRARRVDAISCETKLVIQQYWDENTKTCLDQKKIVNF